MKIKHKIVLLAAAAMAGFASAPASAQGIPVIDPGNIAQTIKVVQNGIQQVQQLQQQVQQVTNMANTLGHQGPLSLATTALRAAGIDFSDLTHSPVAQYRSAMPGLLDALPNSNIGQGLGIPNLSSLASQAKSDLNSGRSFALDAFFKSGNATVDEIQARRGVREAAMRDSVTNGYAMAVYTKNNLSTNETQMQALSQGVQQATDMRTDVQANSAIALAQLQQLTVQNQLLAQLLEVNSTATMTQESTGASN